MYKRQLQGPTHTRSILPALLRGEISVSQKRTIDLQRGHRSFQLVAQVGHQTLNLIPILLGLLVLPRPNAVSYTHLDVYKRQMFADPFAPLKVRDELSHIAAKQGLERVAQLTGGVKPW